ncbi:hypothetical protein GGR56DRAFT_206649 [Xylariaceae sp. FL0804]|nr:hypothetical protein GGR56DRAFT_206649 [Xylariaceae sp. FL0804]
MAGSINKAGLTTAMPSTAAEPSDVELPAPLSFTIRQDPLSVTLDGRDIFGLCLALILTVRLLEPAVVTLLIGAATGLLFVHHDYQNYLRLGPGGTPATFPGYLQISWLRLWALRDPFRPLPPEAVTVPARGILHRRPLPHRHGPRPRVVGIAPQRQVDQAGSRECYLALRRIMARHGQVCADAVVIGTSCFEKHGMGLFARQRPVNATCRGEICHVHDSDHSMHLSLHPDDAREVLEKGWGQRHPLTSRVFTLLGRPVPRQFTMVYAPRTFDELRVAVQIIEAAGWWVTAKEIRMNVLVRLGEIEQYW